MANIPDTTRDIFNKSKRYYPGDIQQGQLVFDWDLNDKFQQIRYWILELLNKSTGSGRFISGGIKSFEITQAAVPANDLSISAGAASVSGRLLIQDSNFTYEDDVNNYIVRGKLSSIVETVPATEYRVQDQEKLWNANYQLPGCRIRFESGALIGQTFDITSLLSQSIVVSGDLSTAAVDDDYVIIPPVIETPPSDSYSQEFYLVTWFEDVSPNEDADLEDPVFVKQPSHRQQMRWVIHKDWAGTNSTDNMSGHIAILLATVTRDTADATIENAEITEESNYIHIQADLSPLLDQNLDTRLTSVEGEIPRVEVIEQLDYAYARRQGVVFTSDLPGSDNLSYTAGKMITGYLQNHPTDPHIVDVSASVVNNTIGGTSYFLVDIDAGNAAVTVYTQTSATLEIQDNDLNVLSVLSTVAGPPHNIEKMYPMGEKLWIQGFDWVLKENPTNELTVSPGQCYRWGTLFQLPDQLSIDPLDSGNYFLGSTPPLTDWVYIYMIPQTGRRDLTIQLSVLEPTFDGSHPRTQGFCVGLFHFDSALPAQKRCLRRGDYIYYPQALFPLATHTGSNSGTLSVLPNNVEEFEFDIDIDNVAGNPIVGINATAVYDALDIWGDGVTVFEVGQSRRKLSVPNFGTISYNIVQGGGDTTIINLYKIKFNPLYMPDRDMWNLA